MSSWKIAVKSSSGQKKKNYKNLVKTFAAVVSHSLHNIIQFYNAYTIFALSIQ